MEPQDRRKYYTGVTVLPKIIYILNSRLSESKNYSFIIILQYIYRAVLYTNIKIDIHCFYHCVSQFTMILNCSRFHSSNIRNNKTISEAQTIEIK